MLKIAPTLEQLAAENPGRITFVTLNVDENPVTAATYRIAGVTLNLLHHDEVVRQIRGAKPKAALERGLEDYVV